MRSVILQRHHPLQHFTILRRSNWNQDDVRNIPITIISRCDLPRPPPRRSCLIEHIVGVFSMMRFHPTLEYVAAKAGWLHYTRMPRRSMTRGGAGRDRYLVACP